MMGGCSNSESAFSRTVRDVSRRRQGVVAVAVQVFLVFLLAAAVVGALLYDSRLYYGIDVNGQPLYEESEYTENEYRLWVVHATTAVHDTPGLDAVDTPLQRTPREVSGPGQTSGNTSVADG
jgi:hypothetical protein